MSLPTDPEVRILTLNCWAIKYVSSKRRLRIEAIARRLHESSHLYDIVALQEVWVEEDYELLAESVKHYLPFSKRWYSGILTGPGLVVFSRWTIESACIHRFPLNGRPSAFWRGDWYVGKAAGSCVIKHPSNKKLEVINAHLHAPYAPHGDANYTCHRASQAWDMTGIIWRAILSGHVVFVTGDLNARPQSVSMRLFEQHLCDAWLVSRGVSTGSEASDFSSHDIAKLSPSEQIECAGVTSDSQLNTWRKNYSIDRAKRLDYIFFDGTESTVSEAKVCFTEPEPVIGSLSDHFGFTASFKLHNGLNTTIPSGRRRRKTLSGLDTLNEILNELLSIIGEYKPVAAWQASWRIAHFWASMAFCIGAQIAIWWGAGHGRSYVGFILSFTSLLIGISGTVNGLIGFVFGHNERRALTEFEQQVRLSQQHLLITS